MWVVWPGDERIDVWHPGERQLGTLHRGDMLDGEDEVPGIRYPVEEVFRDDLD